MTADFNTILKDLKAGNFAPFYLIDGDEPFYLDLLTHHFEQDILQPAERDFNLLVLYGKDAAWPDVVNACRRFPMFAQRQVVILKDAYQMKDLNELAGYLEQPAPTTVFVIEHRFKKADGRSKLVSLAKKKGVYFTSEKIKEEQVPGWIRKYGDEIGFKIGQRESEILATYLGSDLQKIANEIGKVRINVPDAPELSAQLIQKFIGISREYNVFELPKALTSGDKDKLYRMLAYFLANPKAAPMALLVATMYNHFNQLYKAQFIKGMDAKAAAAAVGVPPFVLQEVTAAAKRIQLQRAEQCLLLLAEYSTKAVGIQNNNSDGALLKELVGRLELLLAA